MEQHMREHNVGIDNFRNIRSPKDAGETQAVSYAIDHLRETHRWVYEWLDEVMGIHGQVDDHGIVWFMMGQNASHQFHLGVHVDSGKFYHRSVGEGGEVDEEMSDERWTVYKLEESIRETETLQTYWGHA